MIKLVRCDDRLIHGQCMTKIVKEYDIKRIIVIDESTATNPVLKRIFEMAVPKEMKANVYTATQSIKEIDEASQDSVYTLILMKSPETMRTLLELGANLPNDLNMGPMSKRNDTVSVTPYAHLKKEEIESLFTLEKQQVHIWFRQVPGNSIVEWETVKKKF